MDQAYARVRQGLAGTGLRGGRGATKVKTFLPGDSLPAYQEGVAKLAMNVLHERAYAGDAAEPQAYRVRAMRYARTGPARA
ncbi:hypothetical protein OJ996_23030 [Luteolibacter sp. GHJ8]|uniref:Uncharacterized protein n=1 Tax=Luteolibacter rhizosphaerae TaxID=2989719 RepID=A0ABT3G9G5_9BACT|nr:hypothetical protein [Luteolibacter rhizosphaerae]MCW1916480.1 hypothetical protein [Luteolibacter rhizosphaerae]